MEPPSTPYKVRPCSQCSMDAEYFCVSCPCNLCIQCKRKHVQSLKTIDHLMVFREKYFYMPMKEMCSRHQHKIYIKYCETCHIPVCSSCETHKRHRQIFVKKAYKARTKQRRRFFQNIANEALFYRPILFEGVSADFQRCHQNFFIFQSNIITRAQNLIDRIDDVLNDLMTNVFCDFDFNHRCLKQKLEMNRHIIRLLRYEQRNEQLAIRPVKYILSCKKAAISKMQFIIHTSELSMAKSHNEKDVKEYLNFIKITKKGKRCVENDRLLKMISPPELHQSLEVSNFRHITCVRSDRVWVSNRNNLILKNTSGDILCHRDDLCSNSLTGFGLHTVNRKDELIYIDEKFDINLLSNDMKTITTLIKRTDETHFPQCVYCSPSSGDLLVGNVIFEKRKYTCMVHRYSQTIQDDKKIPELFRKPLCITENNNGDVVVSDPSAVLVTDSEGVFRFSYMGHGMEFWITPIGICTDALSNILVCDTKTSAVQILDKDGQFLSYLLVRPLGIFNPCSLSYDVNTHRLLVGSVNYNKICVFRHVTRLVGQNGQRSHTDEKTGSLSKTGMKITAKKEKDCILKLISKLELQQTITMTQDYGCCHISYMASYRILISCRCHLLLINKKGKTIYQKHDLFCHSSIDGSGRHAVNNENNVFYIRNKTDVFKLPKNWKSTHFLKTNSSLKPSCVHWSTITNELLVGMYQKKTMTGMVFRYITRVDN